MLCRLSFHVIVMVDVWPYSFMIYMRCVMSQNCVISEMWDFMYVFFARLIVTDRLFWPNDSNVTKWLIEANIDYNTWWRHQMET